MNSRVETMTASVARVRALLAEATEHRRRDRDRGASWRPARPNLESLKQQQAYLAGQVALSTVTVDTDRRHRRAWDRVEESENGFLAGLAAGWSALLDFFAWIGAALGALLPFLPLFVVAGVLVWWLVRRLRRRRTAVRGRRRRPGRTARRPAPPVSADTTGLDVPPGRLDRCTDRVPVG